MNPEQLRQFADAIAAHLSGQSVEARYSDEVQWRKCAYPNWSAFFHSNGHTEFRPKPEPKTRPWSKPDDVPGPVCWVRTSHQPTIHMFVMLVWCAGIRCMDNGKSALRFHFQHDADKWKELEYSTDRKQWYPCVVEEAP